MNNSDEENSHPNFQPIMTDRTESENLDKFYVNKIPKGNSKYSEILNSAPHSKSKDATCLDNMIINDPKTYRNLEEERIRSLSNDTKPNFSNSDGHKIVMKKDELGQSSLKSSVHLSSHLTFNLSESAYLQDSYESKKRLSQSNLSNSNIPKYSYNSDYLKCSGHTLEYSEDNDEVCDEESISIADMNNSNDKIERKAKLNATTYLTNLNNYTDPKFDQDKIFVVQNYIDELRQSDENKLKKLRYESMFTQNSADASENCLSLEYAKQSHKEESKIKNICTESLELDDPEDFEQDYDSLRLNINIPTQNTMDIDIHKSLFDQSHSGKLE